MKSDSREGAFLSKERLLVDHSLPFNKGALLIDYLPEYFYCPIYGFLCALIVSDCWKFAIEYLIQNLYAALGGIRHTFCRG